MTHATALHRLNYRLIWDKKLRIAILDRHHFHGTLLGTALLPHIISISVPCDTLIIQPSQC